MYPVVRKQGETRRSKPIGKERRRGGSKRGNKRLLPACLLTVSLVLMGFRKEALSPEPISDRTKGRRLLFLFS